MYSTRLYNRYGTHKYTFTYIFPNKTQMTQNFVTCFCHPIHHEYLQGTAQVTQRITETQPCYSPGSQIHSLFRHGWERAPKSNDARGERCPSSCSSSPSRYPITAWTTLGGPCCLCLLLTHFSPQELGWSWFLCITSAQHRVEPAGDPKGRMSGL